MQSETLEQLVARLNAGAFIPPQDPTANKAAGKKGRCSTMPKAVKLKKGQEFTFRAAGGAAQSKYDWDSWFNPDPKDFPTGLVMLERSTGKENDKGTIVEVSEKRDYEVPTDAMPPKIKTAARRRYKVCQISRLDADGSKLVDALIIKTRDMTADERQAEDLLRAEEKANKKAAQAAEANGQQVTLPDDEADDAN